MKAQVELPENQPASSFPANGKGDHREVILLELEKILASPFFRSAARSKQFLKYVVQNQLEGHSQLLKERTIGTEVFLRPAGYATGDDPVVRVQAGEVRRRLDQYYQSAPDDSAVRIELPVGSYSPVFHMASALVPFHLPPDRPRLPASEFERKRRPIARWGIVGLIVALTLAAGIAALTMYRSAHKDSVLRQFWNPVFATQQPALICLAKGVTYRPSLELYQRYARTHPGTFQTEVDRSNEPLPLDPNEKISWNEMLYYDGYGVATGDVTTAVRLSALLGTIGKPNQLRIGPNYSFEDLRNSPAVVVGAFNNKWTMVITSNLHFAFVEEDGRLMIREQAQGGRTWESQISKTGVLVEDFALVTRLLDSKTGQFTIAAAGIRDSGTQAAGEFVSNQEYLEAGLRNAPAGWEKRNSEFVLETAVTDTIPGPPHVVAAYFW